LSQEYPVAQKNRILYEKEQKILERKREKGNRIRNKKKAQKNREERG